MPQTLKIATCCYCGTRAALVLHKTRHELSCASCGAPLHEMKTMPVTALRQAHSAQMPMPKRRKPANRPAEKRCEKRKPKKSRHKPRRRWGHEMIEELWDIVEDVFD